MHNIARWDGSEWQPLGDGLDNPVLTITRHADRLVAGLQKDFDAAPASPLIAAWDGAAWENIGQALEQDAFSPQIRKLVSGGAYLVAVGFPIFGGVALLDGTSWTVLGDMNSLGEAAELRPEGLYIGGGFGVVNAGPSVGLGLLRPSR